VADAKSDETYEIRPQKVKTLDSKDYDLGWTNQAPNRPVEPEEMNPVTFTKDQLPNPAVMAEQGVPLESYLAHFHNVEGATVDEGVLVDEDSGKPLSEHLVDNGGVEDVPGAPGTNPVAYSKNPALEAPTGSHPAPVDTVEPTKDKAAASKRAAAKKS
jgi:hypothetical protein